MTGPAPNSRRVAMVQLLAIMMMGALAMVLAKLALREVPAFTFVWLQIALGGLLLTFYTFVLRGERIPRNLGARVWLTLVWIGIANFTVVRVLFFLALELLPAITHAYLANFVGIVTMVMSIFLLRETPSLLQILGAILAIAGLRVYFQEIPAAQQLRGVIYVGIAVLALASTNNFTRHLRRTVAERLSNNVLSTVVLWIGGTPVVLVGLSRDGPFPLEGWQNWSILLFAALAGVAVGLTVFNHVLKTLRSYEASILASTGVIFTALFAGPILGEGLGGHEVLGIAMMLAGIALAQIRRSLLRRA